MAFAILLLSLLAAHSLKTLLLSAPQRPPHLTLRSIGGYQELLVDTGSQLSWVSDLTCEKCPLRGRACANMAGDEREVHYGIGWVRGLVQRVELGGHWVTALCTTEARDIGSFKAHGLIAVPPTIKNNLIAEMCKKEGLPASFSIYLGAHFGTLTLGGYLSQLLPADPLILELPLTSNSSWLLDVQAVAFDSLAFKSEFKALVDTGSTHLVLPRPLFLQLLALLEDDCQEREREVSCREGSVLPSIGVQFQGGGMVYLQGEDYSQKRGGRLHLLVTYFLQDSSTIVLGDLFLQKYYTRFDMEHAKIAFSLIEPSLPARQTRLLAAGLLFLIALVLLMALPLRFLLAPLL